MLLRPSPQELARLKAPLGRLLPGGPGEAIPLLRRLIEERKPSMLVTVGDIVTRASVEAGLLVDVMIVDNRSMRKPSPTINLYAENIYRVKNAAGVITSEAWEAIRKAMSEKKSAVIVDGEEDLLTLPAIVEAPDKAFVVYGQPSRGLVVVTATPAKKTSFGAMLNGMSKEEQA